MKIRKPKFVLPRGTVLYLPDGVSLGDFFWNETPEEKCIAYDEQKRRSRLAKLHRLEVVWAAEDAERLHRRAAQLAVVVEKDREYIERAKAIEREEAWCKKQIEDGASVMNKLIARYQEELEAPRYRELLKRLEKAGKEIGRDRCQLEKAELMRRGVYRGRRQNAVRF